MISYSQASQDFFARYILRHSTGASKKYLEVGANDPCAINNTYALELEGWSGVSIDIDAQFADAYQQTRKNPFIVADATKIDWDTFLHQYEYTNGIDYLSFDVDDATIPAFDLFPFEKVRCRAITIEHDHYRVGPFVRDHLRARLQELGYILVCSDVVMENHGCFEDWWVHDSIIDGASAEAIKKISCDGVHHRVIAEIMLEVMLITS
jgi:hypothetical protein